MRRLLAPDGCPWDREQTLETLKPFLLEETYEVLEALDADEPRQHCEELGDLLLQIVFQAELRSRQGHFTVDDVVASIVNKLIRRHPHVFGDVRLGTAAEVLDQWTDLKQKEKPRRTLDGVPRALPALLRAQRLTDRAAQVGFDWPDAAGPRGKIDEEVGELDAATRAGERTRIRDELGDVLFAVVNLSRKLGIDAEEALRLAGDRFSARFAFVEDQLALRGKAPKEATLTEMDELWEAAKKSCQEAVLKK